MNVLKIMKCNTGFAIFFSTIFLFSATESICQENIRISGITEPVTDVIISTEVTGKIFKIYHKEGAEVKKGAPLFSLAGRVEVLEMKRRRVIMDSKAELVSAIEREKTLAKMLASTRDLFEKTKSVTRDELDKLILEHRLAVSEIDRLNSSEEREKLEFEIAKATLNKKTVYSPANAIINEIFFDQGEICETPEPVMHLVNPYQCWFVCNMDEKSGKGLKEQKMVKVEIKTDQGPVLRDAKLVFISPVVDSASGLVKVKARLANRDRIIRPGASGFLILPRLE